MVILFRLLFVAYAEDKDLLPYRSNSLYEARSLKRLAIETAEQHSNGHICRLQQRVDRTCGTESRTCGLRWRAADLGGVFPPTTVGCSQRTPPSARRVRRLRICASPTTSWVRRWHGCCSMTAPEDIGPVDFRSLSVREFGTIYEGLLESRLAVATDDLTVKATSGGDEQYVPAAAGDDIHVHADEVYLERRVGPTQGHRLVLHQTLLRGASA